MVDCFKVNETLRLEVALMQQELSLSKPPSLLPETLIQSVQLIPPSHFVTVKGRVARLSEWSNESPNIIWGDLEWNNISIKFRCSPQEAPSVLGEMVVIYGTLAIEPHRASSGFDIIINGSVVDRWLPKDLMSQEYQIKRTHPKKALSAFFEHYYLHEMVFFIERNDQVMVREAFNKMKMEKYCRCYIYEVNDMKVLLEELKKIEAKAIIFVKNYVSSEFDIGNNPMLIDFFLESKSHFYTVLGKKHTIESLDKEADEYFISIEHCVQTIEFNLKTIEDNKQLKQKIDELNTDNKNLSLEKDSLYMQLNQSKSRAKEILEEMKLKHNQQTSSNRKKAEKMIKTIRKQYQFKIWSVISVVFVLIALVVLFRLFL